MRVGGNIKRILSVMALLMVTCLGTLRAQNNPYQISDDCYRYMLRINKVVRKPESLAMCDTMMQMAKRKGDLKAQCISVTLRMLNLLNANNPRIEEVFNQYKPFLAQTPYLQYLYASWGNISSYYQRLGNIPGCLRVLNEMREYATRHNHSYGIAQAHRALGSVYHETSDFASSFVNYKKAYDVMVGSKDTKNIYDVESKIGLLYNERDSIDQAVRWMRRAVDHAPEVLKLSPLLLYANLVFTYSSKFSMEEMENVNVELEAIIKKHPPTTYTQRNNYCTVKTRYYLRKKNIKKAIAYADSVKSERMRYNIFYTLYKETHQLDSALYYLEQKQRLERITWNTANRDLMIKMAAANDSSDLALRTQRLLITQLQERELMLQVQQQKARLELINSDLELASRKNLLLAEQRKTALSKAESRANQLELQRQKERNAGLLREKALNERRQQALIVFVLVMFMAAVFIYAYMQRSNARLKREKAIAEAAKYQAEQQRLVAEDAMDKAQKADRLKSLFLQNMSHEIRTPLNAIVGFNEVLNGEASEGLEPEERKEFLGLIETNTHLLTTLINDILDLSKLESGTYKLDLAQVEVNTICQAAIRSVEGRNREGVKLVYKPSSFPITLHTDAARLQQVLINFLTNACKNTEQGSITLACELTTVEGKSYARFSVTDTGCGVPIEKSKAIFARFEKLDNFKQGTGLGLSIVTLICKLLHGHVYLDTAYKKGARFVFEHPIETV